jgi:hypothetical protein
LEKRKEINLDVRNIFAGPHTEHQYWRCSKLVVSFQTHSIS